MPARSDDRRRADQFRLDQQRVRRWSVAVITVFAVLGFGFGTWLSRLPAVRDHLGATTLEMSVYGLSMGIGSLVGLAFSGRAVAWFGARRTLMVCLSVQAVAMVATINMFWIEQVAGGMALLFSYGFFFSISDVAANVSGAEAERAVGRPRMPAFHGCYSLGAVATMGLGAAAEAAHITPPVHISAAIVLAAAVGLIALRWIPRDHAVGAALAGSAATPEPPSSVITGPIPTMPPGAPVAAPTRPRREYSPWRDPRIYLVGLIALSMSLSEGTGSDWISLALVDGRGFSNSLATLGVGVFFAAMVTTRFAGSFLLERFGRVTMIRASAALCAVGLVALILVPVPWVAVLGIAMWGGGCALGFPVGISAAADDPATAVRSVAAVSMIAYGAFLVGPPMIGFLGEHFGLLPAFWPVAVCALACVVIAGATRRRSGETVAA